MVITLSLSAGAARVSTWVEGSSKGRYLASCGCNAYPYVRLLLEGEAAERGSLRLTAADQAGLHDLSRHMAVALSASDAKGYLQANEEFHLRLYRAAGSPTLLALIETVWLKVGPLSNRLFDHADALRVLNDGHEDVLQAIAVRDSVAVRRGVERDLFVAGQFLRLACQGK